MSFSIRAPAAFAAAALALPLVGCAPTQAEVQAALNIVCPSVAALARDSASGALTSTERTALGAFQSACPPNPAPTDLASMGLDLLAAQPTLLAALARLHPATALATESQLRAVAAKHGASGLIKF
jgi:hypothetical protein